jgi:hypothetical protein
MDINLRVERRLIMKNVLYKGYVETAGSNIGAD